MKFGDKLKELRLSQKITQRKLAAALDVAPSIYNRFERNERKVKREMLPQLASLLNIAENELTKFWVADKVYKLIEDEEEPEEVISMVSEQLCTYNPRKEYEETSK